MKKFFLPFLLLTAFFSFSTLGYDRLPAKYSGSMMPYEFSMQDTVYDVPEGFVPVHISYVARHGARYLSSRKKVAKIEKALMKARNKDALSEKGKSFLKMIESIADSSEGRWGLLSPVGIAEEKRLGTRMAAFGKNLFKSGKAVSISTFVPRVIMTMYEFNHSLEREHQELQLFTSSGHQNDSLLYCFDTFSEYRDFRDSGSWEKIYAGFVDRHVPAAPAERLFTPGYMKGDSRKLRDLTMEMYGVIQGNEAAGFAPPTTEWMSEEEYRQCYLASNLKHYLRNTPNQIDPYCAPATSMLIDRIISDADKALKDGDEVFSGYFGHCETLLPLLAVMNVPGCFTRTSDYEALHKSWQLEEISPLAANLMIIFLKEEQSGEIYVALRHNGMDVAPYQDADKKIISWIDLKQYWLRRMASFSRPKAKLL